MNDFSKYNKTFSADEQAQVDSVKNQIVGGGSSKRESYPEPVQGKYIATIDKMYLREEKDRLVFRLTMQLLEGEDEDTRNYMASWPGKTHPRLPFARPITGTKNDSVCLGSVVGLLNRFAETDGIECHGDFNQLAETIDSVFATAKDRYAYLIEYNPEKFYRISVLSILAPEDAEDNGTAPAGAVPQEENEVPDIKQVKPIDIQRPTSMPPESDFDHAKYDSFEDDLEEDLPF